MDVAAAEALALDDLFSSFLLFLAALIEAFSALA